MSKSKFLIATAVALAGLVGSAHSQDASRYPNRRIHLVIGASPGSSPDVVCRLLARRLEARLKQTIVPENKFGAGGYVGFDAVARAAPDGYTLLCTAELALYSDIFDKSQREILRELPVIAAFSSTPLVLLVPSSMKIKTLPEFVSLVRANPKKYNVGFPVNSTYMLEIMGLLRTTGMEVGEIAYQSMAQSINGLLGGDLQLIMTTLSSAAPLMESGRAVAIATTGAKRFSLMPNVATVQEQGVEMSYATWYGLFGSNNLPSDIRAKLRQEVAAAMSGPEAAAAINGLGMEPLAADPGELTTTVTNNVGRYRKLLEKSR